MHGASPLRGNRWARWVPVRPVTHRTPPVTERCSRVHGRDTGNRFGQSSLANLPVGRVGTTRGNAMLFGFKLVDSKESAQAQFARVERPRRALNVIVALVGLVLTLPVWALIAIAIKLTSRGPVFYKQERIGLDLRSSRPRTDDPRRKRDLGGRPFMMYKFRTMCV